MTSYQHLHLRSKILLISNIHIARFSIPWFAESYSAFIKRQDAYECGFEAFIQHVLNSDLSFFMVSIIFLLFDIEILFLIPTTKTFDIFGICPFFEIFYLCIFLGLLAEIRFGIIC